MAKFLKQPQVARIGVMGGGFRRFGQCPKENVFFPLTPSLIETRSIRYGKLNSYFPLFMKISSRDRYEIIYQMNEIILNVSSRDNLEILLMIEISSRDLLNQPSWPVCPASFLQSYFSRQRSTSLPPRSSQAHSQSSSRLERYREMRRMRDASKNNLK